MNDVKCVKCGQVESEHKRYAGGLPPGFDACPICNENGQLINWHPTNRFTPAESPASQIQLERQTMGQLSARIAELEQKLAAVEHERDGTRSDFKAMSRFYHEARTDCDALRAENERLRKVLEWIASKSQCESYSVPGMGSGLPHVWRGCAPHNSDDPEEWCLCCAARAALEREGRGGVSHDCDCNPLIGGAHHCLECGGETYPSDACVCPSPSAPRGRCQACFTPLVRHENGEISCLMCEAVIKRYLEMCANDQPQPE